MLDTLLKSLAIDPRVLALNAGAFLVLLFLMDRIFWKPVLRHLDKRKAAIAEAYRTVEETRTEMEDLRGEYQARLSGIESEARERIQQTVRDAQGIRERIIADARARTEQVLQEGLADIEAERLTATDEMTVTLRQVALQALASTTGTQTGDAERALVDEYIAGAGGRN